MTNKPFGKDDLLPSISTSKKITNSFARCELCVHTIKHLALVGVKFHESYLTAGEHKINHSNQASLPQWVHTQGQHPFDGI